MNCLPFAIGTRDREGLVPNSFLLGLAANLHVVHWCVYGSSGDIQFFFFPQWKFRFVAWWPLHLHMRPIHCDMHGPEEKSVAWEGTHHTRARAHGRQWSPWQDATNLRWTGVVYTRVPVDVAMMFIHNALFSCPLLNQSWRPRGTSHPLTRSHHTWSAPPDIFIGAQRRIYRGLGGL